MLGGMNQLEVTFYCSRFKVSFPLFARFENIEVECYKLSVFLLTYLFYSGYHSWKSKNKRHLELLLKA